MAGDGTPEVPNNNLDVQQGAGDAAVQQSLQQDSVIQPSDLGNLSSVFAPKDNVSNVLGDVNIGDNADTSPFADSSDAQDIASMTQEELETAIGEQRNYVNNIESQLASVSQASQAAEVKQQADRLAEADAYFAGGMS